MTFVLLMLLALVPLIKSDEGNKCGQRPGSGIIVTLDIGHHSIIDKK